MNEVTFRVNDIELNFLVDNGVSLCAIKNKVLSNNINVYKHKVSIKGVGDPLILQGYVYLQLKIVNVQFNQGFYILHSLASNTDGILGQNF